MAHILRIDVIKNHSKAIQYDQRNSRISIDTRQRYFRLRKTLQHTGTRSARRKLRKLSGKETRFKKDVNHAISKHIISKAKGTTRSQRDRHSKWAFGELRQFLTYKAKHEGVPLRVIDPKNTSRECPKCQYVDKKNRNKNQFECLQCGYNDMADYVAEINIAARAAAWFIKNTNRTEFFHRHHVCANYQVILVISMSGILLFIRFLIHSANEDSLVCNR